MILELFSLLYMMASFFACLGVGFNWSYSEDKSFWNKKLLNLFLVYVFVVVTNGFIFHLLAKESSAKVPSECRHKTTLTK